MKFDILTLFPAMFEGPLTESILRRGIDRGLLEIRCRNIRDYGVGKHRVTDDAPFGGGAGMVMKPEPIAAAVEAAKVDSPNGRVILTSPRGKRFDDAAARRLSREESLIIICGRYEGVDERVHEFFVDEEISLGDFVLTGGEPAAIAIVDAVSRFVPGVLGCDASAETDSFSDGLLEYPQYTRPEEFRGARIPDVLLSGNHAEIARWRRRQSLLRTAEERPDLLRHAELTESDRRYLRESGFQW